MVPRIKTPSFGFNINLLKLSEGVFFVLNPVHFCTIRKERDVNIYKGNERRVDWDLVAQIICDWIDDSVKAGDALLPQNLATIKAQLAGGECAVVFDRDQVVGYLTTYLLGTDSQCRAWYEVGTGIVPKERRREGIGADLYKYIAKRHPTETLVCTTKNPVALRLSVSAGFEIRPFSDVPTEIRQGLCYTAPCYVAIEGGCCASQQELGGTCYARIRLPLK